MIQKAADLRICRLFYRAVSKVLVEGGALDAVRRRRNPPQRAPFLSRIREGDTALYISLISYFLFQRISCIFLHNMI